MAAGSSAIPSIRNTEHRLSVFTITNVMYVSNVSNTSCFITALPGYGGYQLKFVITCDDADDVEEIEEGLEEVLSFTEQLLSR